MNNHHLESNFISPTWIQFIDKYSLSPTQIDQFKRYLELLIEWNTKFNLTAITDPESIIKYHFDDSLSLTKHIDFSALKTTADVGTGAGFPGLPLKILFPHLKMILIEVNNKKRSFLEHVTQELGLGDIIIYPFDWRTFLRTNEYNIDYFFARASLQPEELVRVFKPSCAYKEAILVYWASKQWTPNKAEAPFVEKEIVYKLDTIERKFVLFKKTQQ